ncbi:uncharacterized protein LAESUDRAFT_201126 [Laetiporus sulphureus 93-53]|uniref:Uncharacterized protein n=1 Tax=Laetiporus sulphureus 93-53 TaxID=1314785 RepID=A0A165E3S2_9APHY|nr:uncharacterized protein LAESUDRAFT_201126 [Laetiporus sulphureus 93-53]KZT06195.1 hypothetical protein LAESUDRAFT_201126 [Laetiporus sulphureus 93-53]
MHGYRESQHRAHGAEPRRLSRTRVAPKLALVHRLTETTTRASPSARVRESGHSAFFESSARKRRPRMTRPSRRSPPPLFCRVQRRAQNPMNGMCTASDARRLALLSLNYTAPTAHRSVLSVWPPHSLRVRISCAGRPTPFACSPVNRRATPLADRHPYLPQAPQGPHLTVTPDRSRIAMQCIHHVQ